MPQPDITDGPTEMDNEIDYDDPEPEAQSSPDNGGGDFPATQSESAYIAIDGISPDDFSDDDKEQLIIQIQNMLLATFGYPIEGVRLVESPRYAVEFSDE